MTNSSQMMSSPRVRHGAKCAGVAFEGRMIEQGTSRALNSQTRCMKSVVFCNVPLASAASAAKEAWQSLDVAVFANNLIHSAD